MFLSKYISYILYYILLLIKHVFFFSVYRGMFRNSATVTGDIKFAVFFQVVLRQERAWMWLRSKELLGPLDTMSYMFQMCLWSSPPASKDCNLQVTANQLFIYISFVDVGKSLKHAGQWAMRIDLESHCFRICTAYASVSEIMQYLRTES